MIELFAGLSLVGYLLFIVLNVLVVVLLWRWIARIRIPWWHLLLLISAIFLLTILTQAMEVEGGWCGALILLTLPYLIIWTIIYKRRYAPPDSLDQAKSALERAYAAQGEGNLEEALEACDAALVAEPDWPEAYNLKGLILEHLGRREEALTAYSQAVRYGPAYEEARQNLKRLREGLGAGEF